jgi:hypothetical protein
MSWGAIAGAAIGVVGNYLGNKGNERGADAAAGAQYAAIEEQRRQYDQTRQDMAPWLAAGREGLGGLQQLLANPDSIQNSTAYQWRLGQGTQALDRSAAARGGLFNGGHSADLIRFGQGEASQEFGNQWNRLAGLAGVGQTTASNLGSLGANMAGNIGNALGNIGQARQSMYQQQGQNNANLAYGIGGAFNNWYQGQRANNPGGTGWYLGNNPGRG